jgi:formylglycine-generating enzyme required for sulfatase activity
VANPGNAADTRYDANGYGAVSYAFNMGKFEVTAGQYTSFLNAVAKTDTYSLYNTYMGSGGENIQRTGTDGNYEYNVASDWANRPANRASWGDAARYCNWLTNGQPTGAQDASTTEDGSYYLNGATSISALQAVTRKTAAQGGRYYIPTEDEWYKAAYHKNDGTTGNYWDYPTGSNSTPIHDLLNPDGGNNANFSICGDPNGQDLTIGNPYYRTLVGEFESSQSSYGTYDQGGNVGEWNEAIVSYDSLSRGIRGGSFDDPVGSLSGGARAGDIPTFESRHIGFRIVEVPEPATMLLAGVGGLTLLRRRRSMA